MYLSLFKKNMKFKVTYNMVIWTKDLNTLEASAAKIVMGESVSNGIRCFKL